MKLHEKFRPSCWAEVVGQDKVMRQIDCLRRAGGLAGRAYWISGPSGTGKTTIARLIAEEVATPFYTQEIDGRELTESKVEDMKFALRYRPLEGQAHVFIVNEAHALRPAVITRLLVLIDDLIPDWAVFIFTTTDDAQEELFDARLNSSAFLSRCEPLDLAQRGLAGTPARKGEPPKPGPFAVQCHRIAEQEGLNGKPLAAYVRLLQECKNNLRMALQRVGAGEMLQDSKGMGQD